MDKITPNKNYALRIKINCNTFHFMGKPETTKKKGDPEIVWFNALKGIHRELDFIKKELQEIKKLLKPVAPNFTTI